MARVNPRATLALVLDVVLILLFAGLGRRSHELGLDPLGIVVTAAPFLIAWFVAILITRAGTTWAKLWPAGVIVWAITVAGGLLIRVTVFGDTAAWSFQIVTASVLGVFLLGRRAVTSMIARGRSRSEASRP